jgi:ATP-dependent protease HslVU (ClpYQ) peptidase subunit
MTCIVAMKDGDKIIMGSDDMVSRGEEVIPAPTKKTFKKDGFLFGCAGYTRAMQLVQYNLDMPERGVDEILDNYIFKKLIPAMRALWANNGMKKDGGSIEWTPNTFLMATEGRIFEVEPYFTVFEFCEYASIGSGAKYAQGAMHALSDSKLKPKARITKALQAAANFARGVSDRFEFEEL